MLLSIKQILAIPDPRFPANPFYQLLSYQKDDKNPTNLVQWQDIDLTKSDGRSDFLINHLEDTESSGTTSDSSDDFVMISKNSLNGWFLPKYSLSVGTIFYQMLQNKECSLYQLSIYLRVLSAGGHTLITLAQY